LWVLLHATVTQRRQTTSSDQVTTKSKFLGPPAGSLTAAKASGHQEALSRHHGDGNNPRPIEDLLHEGEELTAAVTEQPSVGSSQ